MKKIAFYSLLFVFLIPFRIYSQSTLDLKVYLEGTFNGTEMNVNLNPGVIPLSQPYNSAPWNYTGTEQVSSIPNADVVDWILIEIRETTGGASTATSDKTILTRAGFLLKNGHIAGTDGSSAISFTETITHHLYVVIRHRNHLAIMSSEALVASGGNYSWDFTNQLSSAYLNGQKQIGSGVYGMIAGDSDGSGKIDATDKDPLWTLDAGKQGYYASDLNLDSEVNNPDKNNCWEQNQGMITVIPGVPFACGQTLTDARDGETYNTVLIGSQCWMAENLNIGTMINGSSDQTDNSVIEKYCYANSASNCDVYGGLYQWNEMMEYVTTPGTQGICPEGWHIPTDAEWCILEGQVDPTITCSSTSWRGVDGGGKLKEAGTAHWSSPNAGATNASGFTGLPGGIREPSGSFNGVTVYTILWSSDEDGPNGWYRSLHYNFAQVSRFNDEKVYGFSARCLADMNLPPDAPSNPSPANGSVNISLDTTLSWYCADPEDDILFYDIYFGSDANPPLMVTLHPDTFYTPGTLNYSTEYFWKIVAYDTHGDSTVGEVWSFTSAPWSCGNALIVNHNAGDIAPVTKTVIYGTVQTNFTVINQCWITQNLGADQQAASATDATEASAGWYWQFNRKQGYKHDGTTLTPAWTITYIDENSDWLIANDPCALLLGTGWRLPTDTEWSNADVIGGWNNYNDTYASVLKLHAAGCISSNGSLNDRGVYGNYWSSNQENIIYGLYLTFYSNFSYMYFGDKASGFSSRCLRNVSAWSCDQPLIIAHTAGDIAPVTKTIDYGTVETNLTGSNKCWITQNLGSDHQATSATDTTEASAGWYWQFNRKQGYKHDGTNLTPAWNINYEFEESDWLIANDPCVLLGIGWRLPTYTEWNNADINGGWNNYNQTYASVLKIHAAGYLEFADGDLNNSGISGFYWSSTQLNNVEGWYLGFTGSNSGISDINKAFGFSSRCLKDVPTWSCGDPLIDNRDFQTYPTVQIGTQCWMAANLNIGTMISGTSNPDNNSVIEKYCYSNNPANCNTYGGLYQWNEMMQYSATPGIQGICPEGWHLPSDTEWCTLEQQVDPTISCSSTGFRGVDGGGKLKEAGTTHWESPNNGATNASGFTGLPGGFRDWNGLFSYLTLRANLWSSSENEGSAWYRSLNHYGAQVYRYYDTKAFGFSVRCLRD